MNWWTCDSIIITRDLTICCKLDYFLIMWLWIHAGSSWVTSLVPSSLSLFPCGLVTDSLSHTHELTIESFATYSRQGYFVALSQHIFGTQGHWLVTGTMYKFHTDSIWGRDWTQAPATARQLWTLWHNFDQFPNSGATYML